MTPNDHVALEEALTLATAACAAASLPGPDDDKDLVELGQALRAGTLTAEVSSQARKVFHLRQRVVTNNLGLAYHLARAVKKRHQQLDLDDIRQFAAKELCKAVARFRPEKSSGRGGYLSFVIFKATDRWAGRVRRRRQQEVSFSDTVTHFLYSGGGPKERLV